MKTLALAALMFGWTAQAAGPMAVSVGDPALLFTLQALNEDAAVASAGSAGVACARRTERPRWAAWTLAAASLAACCSLRALRPRCTACSEVAALVCSPLMTRAACRRAEA